MPHAVVDRRPQQSCAAVLAHLLALELPIATWTLSGGLSAGHMDGQIGRSYGSAFQRRADIGRWAEALGSDPLWKLYTDPVQGADLEISLTYRGARLRVWTHLSVEDLGELGDRSPVDAPAPALAGSGAAG